MYGFDLMPAAPPLSGCVVKAIRSNWPADLSGKVSVGLHLCVILIIVR
jgi:hypothetical protein